MVSCRLVDNNLPGSQYITQWYKPLKNFTKTFPMLRVLTKAHNSGNYYTASECSPLKSTLSTAGVQNSQFCKTSKKTAAS